MCEHAAGGYVFTEPETVTRLATRFDTLRGESYRVSESPALIGRMRDVWTTGVSALQREQRRVCVETASGSGLILVRDTTDRMASR